MKNTQVIIFALFLAACTSEPREVSNSKPENTATDSTLLQEVLDKKKARFNASADSTKKQVYAAGIQAVVDAKITKKALQVGNTAPNFVLTNTRGEKISLYNELKKGPVILIWYRGGWCPYCNLTLQAMQDMLPLYKAGGAQLFALAPEAPDSSVATAGKNALEYGLLTDYDNITAKKYGVVYQLTPEVKIYYEKGFGLSGYNGNNKGELPLAATYVIGTDKKITYAYLDADYRNRAEPMAVLDALSNTR